MIANLTGRWNPHPLLQLGISINNYCDFIFGLGCWVVVVFLAIRLSYSRIRQEFEERRRSSEDGEVTRVMSGSDVKFSGRQMGLEKGFWSSDRAGSGLGLWPLF